MRLIWALGLGAVGCAILIALGVWQTQRLQWKTAILADIDARIVDAPAALPKALDPIADRYLPVAMSGVLAEGELHVLTSIKGSGPGFRVIAPFVTDDGRRILLDRGFVPEVEKDTARDLGALNVVGNVHWPDETDSFTPSPDIAGNFWFARDVTTMAVALETEPLMVIARESDPPGPLPLPVTSDGVPNNHLEYAITWFSLAVVWAGMTAFLVWRIRWRHV